MSAVGAFDQQAVEEVERFGELFLINQEKVVFLCGARAPTSAHARAAREQSQTPASPMQVMATDRNRQQNREALAALRQQQRATETPLEGSQRSSAGADGHAAALPPCRVWLKAPMLPAGLMGSGAADATAPPSGFLQRPLPIAIAHLEAEHARLEAMASELREESRRLAAQLAEQGGVPQRWMGWAGEQ